MQKDFATLGDLTVAFGIPCIKILSIDVAEDKKTKAKTVQKM